MSCIPLLKEFITFMFLVGSATKWDGAMCSKSNQLLQLDATLVAIVPLMIGDLFLSCMSCLSICCQH